jgi:hypothetical protein
MTSDGGELVYFEFKVGGTELERLVVTCDDLAFLRQLSRDKLPSHTEVRIVAGMLRRLLIDGGGELFKVWRHISSRVEAKGIVAPLTVEARDLGAFLAMWNHDWVFHAWAGGAKFSGGARHSLLCLYKVPKEVHEPYGSTEAFVEAQGLPQHPPLATFKLAQWLDTPGAAIQTDHGLFVISRKSIISYVANRKGGVHFDPRRNLSPRSPNKRRRTAEHQLLDHGLLRVGHLSGPEYEVMSVAQVLADADWASELIRIGNEVAPKEFGGDPMELRFWSGMREEDGTGWATMRFTANE